MVVGKEVLYFSSYFIVLEMLESFENVEISNRDTKCLQKTELSSFLFLNEKRSVREC